MGLSIFIVKLKNCKQKSPSAFSDLNVIDLESYTIQSFLKALCMIRYAFSRRKVGQRLDVQKQQAPLIPQVKSSMTVVKTEWVWYIIKMGQNSTMAEGMNPPQLSTIMLRTRIPLVKRANFLPH